MSLPFWLAESEKRVVVMVIGIAKRVVFGSYGCGCGGGWWPNSQCRAARLPVIG